ncbi:ulp1 protease family, C-terminal catalytic domain-containing protein [Tanacetum coccineum]
MVNKAGDNLEEMDKVLLRIPPISLFRMMTNLTEEQSQSVRVMGFGDILEYRLSEIPTRLGYWVLDKFNEDSCSLIFGGNTITFTRETVHKVLGIPMGIIHVALKGTSCSNKLTKSWKGYLVGILILYAKSTNSVTQNVESFTPAIAFWTSSLLNKREMDNNEPDPSCLGLSFSLIVVLGCDCQIDTHNQASIAHNGGIMPLLKLLDSNNGTLQHNGAFTLYGLADNEDNIADLISLSVDGMGTSNGKPSGLVRIADCGEISKDKRKKHRKYSSPGSEIESDSSVPTQSLTRILPMMDGVEKSGQQRSMAKINRDNELYKLWSGMKRDTELYRPQPLIEVDPVGRKRQ